MRLLDLPDDVQELIRTRRLSVSHGIALAKYKAFPAVVSAIAALAVKEDLNAHQVEKIQLSDYRLSQGINPPLRRLDWAEFDRSICKSCPFDAYRKGSSDYYGAVCLNPAHFDELTEAAKAQKEAERAEIVATAAAEGPGSIIDLSALNYSEYTRCYGDVPGCNESCPCRRIGKERDGKAMPVCIDPERYGKLREAQQVEEAAFRQERHDFRLERVLDRLNESDETTQDRALAIIAAYSLQWTDVKHVRSAVEHIQPEGFEVGKWQSKSKADIAKQLAAMSTYYVWQLAIEVILRSELSQTLWAGDRETSLTDLFMDGVAE
jgi:hypothetical protein